MASPQLLPALLRKDATSAAFTRLRGQWFTGIDLGTTNSSAAVVDWHALRRGDLKAGISMVPVRQAEFPVSERMLLDEPNAALLDYLLTQAEHERVDFSAPRIVLIFDFGGGTCDVSIVRAQVSGDGRLALSNLAISRYEQLGGDNIDGAIAEKVLLPNLLRDNGVDPLDIGWAEKKNRLLPQLLDAAEALRL